MLNVDEARRAREALGSVLQSIDVDGLAATKAQRAVIAGAVAALDELHIGTKVKRPRRAPEVVTET